MKAIQASINRSSSPDEVANLQDALLLLLDRGLIRQAFPPGASSIDELRAITERLRLERTAATFGDATAKLLQHFQIQSGLGDQRAGLVDAETAARLNATLASLGVQEQDRAMRVHGRITYSDGKAGAQLRVCAFDRDVSAEDLLGETTTDDKGSYAISYTESQFRSSTSERGGPELFIRVLDASGQQLAQSKAVNNAPEELDLDLILPTDAVIHLVVRGRVAGSDGNVVSGLQVRAFDRNVGADDTLLGEATTDAQGNYAITYSQEQLEGKSAADLVVALYRSAQDAPLQSSDVIFDAGPETVKDFVISVRPASEFDRLVEQIRPLLRGKVGFAQLDARQIAFLSKKSKLSERKLEQLAQSHRLAGDNEPLAAFYYGMLSQGLSTEPAALLRLAPSLIANALQRASAQGLIAPLKPADVDAILGQTIPRLRAQKLLAPAKAGQPPSVGDLLRLADQPLDDDEQYKVADSIGANAIDYMKLRDQLRAAGMPSDKALCVERTLRLGDLTQRNLSLINDLQKLTANENDASLKLLIAVTRDVWIDKAYAFGLPAGVQVSAETYARQLESSLEDIHPTATLAARINSGHLTFTAPGFETAKLGTFLKNNPSFDINVSNIPAFIANANLGGIDNRDELTQSLVKLQRVRKLAASWDETAALLNRGVDSAVQAVKLGMQRMQERLETDVEHDRASAIYQNAKKMHDFGLALMARVLPRFTPTAVSAMGGSVRLDDGAISETLRDSPSLQELFGPLDYCECRPERSVLSPAAYFVDLMQFVKDAGALDALLKRRPDLADLKLSANNMETELPYIDLVLEIFENEIALPKNVTLPVAVCGKVELDKKSLSRDIVNVLQTTSLETIGSNLQAVPVEKQLFPCDGTYDYTVTDRQRRWTLRASAERGITIAIPASEWAVRVAQSELGRSFQQIMKELDAGSLSRASRDYIASLLPVQCGRGSHMYLDVVEKGVTVVAPGSMWKVSAQYGVNVTIVPETDRLVLTTPDGTKVYEHGYSQKAMLAIREWLEQGAIRGPLAGLIPLRRKYLVTRTGPNSWSIRQPAFETWFIYVADTLTINSLTHQTIGDTEDMKACPANQDPIAYAMVRKANFPWSLPFNLPLDSVRACLERAGVTRRRLIELTIPQQSKAFMPYKYLGDARWVNEVLGLSPEESTLIATSAEPPQIWTYWGITSGSNTWLRLFDASAGGYEEGTPVILLSIVSILMQQARIDYDDLLAVLA